MKLRISSENALSELEDLMSQIFARKAENAPAIPYVAYGCMHYETYFSIVLHRLNCLPE